MTKSPNILFFFPDQHRFDWIGSRPEIPVRTPHLDALTARGVQFNNAITPSPVCAPARACLASGMEYDQCGVPSNGFNYPPDGWTVYQSLRQADYNVLGCGKFDLHKATPSWGLDGKGSIGAWGFSDGIDNAGKWDAVRSGAEEPKDPYMNYLHQNSLVQTHLDDMHRRQGNKIATFATDLPEEAYCDNWVAQNGIDLLDHCLDDQPWFLQINFTGPHDPWDVTHRMKATYAEIEFPSPFPSSRFSAEEHNQVRQNYSAMVENIDRWLGVYVDLLQDKGQLENTLIVFSSDHGEMLGDHNRWGKSLPYQTSIGVPLVVAGPEVESGLVTDTLVSLIDLTATFLDAADLQVPSGMAGQSLKPVLSGHTKVHRQRVRSGLGDWRLVYDGRYKLIQNFEDRSWLFDLEDDPAESQNLFAENPDLVAELQRFLGSHN